MRITHGGELLGLFLVDEAEGGAQRVLGIEGVDVTTTLQVAQAALLASLVPM